LPAAQRPRLYVPNLQMRPAAAMSSGDWLTSYRNIEGIETALRNMERRIGRGAALSPAADAVRSRYGEFRDDFETLFADLREIVAVMAIGTGP